MRFSVVGFVVLAFLSFLPSSSVLADQDHGYGSYEQDYYAEQRETLHFSLSVLSEFFVNISMCNNYESECVTQWKDIVNQCALKCIANGNSSPWCVQECENSHEFSCYTDCEKCILRIQSPFPVALTSLELSNMAAGADSCWYAYDDEIADGNHKGAFQRAITCIEGVVAGSLNKKVVISY